MPPTLTAVMVTAGPSTGLVPNLTRVREIADEVVLLDLSRHGNSAAGDADIRRVTVARSEASDLSEAYHFAMAHATSEWVLLLGPGEQPAKGFGQAWAAFDGGAHALEVELVQRSLGRDLRGDHRAPRRVARLARRASGFTVRRVRHFDRLELDAPAAVALNASIVRDPLGDLDCLLRTADLESDWILRAAPGAASLTGLVTCAPRAFASSYVGRGGWRDGVPGFFLACLAAANAFAHAMKSWIDDQPVAEA